jgi:starch synthase
MKSLNIAMVSSEIDPLAKSGGLADVLAALPSELIKRGHRACVFLPAYRCALARAEQVEDLHLGFPIALGGQQVSARVLRTTLDGGKLPVYLIDQPQFYDREFLYGDRSGDYQDNCARFIFFNRAVLETIRRLRLPVDIIHCHDWQSGLVPAYLKSGVERIEHGQAPASVMTIHNLAYQGRFWAPDFPMTGLPWETFNADGVEFYGDLCFLKSGLIYADQITTVSPNYAEEIKRPEFGCGLDGVLRSRADRLTGIVNGVDYEVWDPSKDTNLAQRYDSQSWKLGKRKCKEALIDELGLTKNINVPLIGIVARLASQKGWDIAIPVIERMLERSSAQFVILGNGEERYKDWLQHVRSRFGDRIAILMTFSESLAHKIEASTDIFLMPSQYEPCGLNQLYSLRYGTVPVVHAVGGLVDTVRRFHKDFDIKQATGFTFNAYNADALDECLTEAVNVYRENSAAWEQLVLNGMSQNWSWDVSAATYETVYASALRSIQM